MLQHIVSPDRTMALTGSQLLTGCAKQLERRRWGGGWCGSWVMQKEGGRGTRRNWPKNGLNQLLIQVTIDFIVWNGFVLQIFKMTPGHLCCSRIKSTAFTGHIKFYITMWSSSQSARGPEAQTWCQTSTWSTRRSQKLYYTAKLCILYLYTQNSREELAICLFVL